MTSSTLRLGFLFGFSPSSSAAYPEVSTGLPAVSRHIPSSLSPSSSCYLPPRRHHLQRAFSQFRGCLSQQISSRIKWRLDCIPSSATLPSSQAWVILAWFSGESSSNPSRSSAVSTIFFTFSSSLAVVHPQCLQDLMKFDKIKADVSLATQMCKPRLVPLKVDQRPEAQLSLRNC